MKMNKKGFTLIELLIVVAIIAILAAIAIPQFASYRMRGYNAAAVADLRNVKTAEEAAFADYQSYGKTQNATLAAATNVTGAVGAVYLVGPLTAANQLTAGAMISGPTSAGTPFGLPIAISNGVLLTAGSLAPVAPSLASPSYTLISKNTNGDRVFGTETESTAVSFVSNITWAGQALSVPPTGFVLPGVALTVDVTGASGGSPNPNWAAM
jgi:type IV pilus assembly protein PilA